ncbi:MAG: leucine--tRNA ligase [Oscillospiraceae bacterium]|jgi:leucyl-tRNA synthetase|nr:leucine--tRNA ligase [Oscillospiraceae bacterium]
MNEMNNQYTPGEIEPKWQKIWLDGGFFRASDGDGLKNFYCLIEFPYPSGVGLHIGHPRPYTGMDVLARTRRMQGYNVLFPIGWDAFGLPAENYAIKNNIHPSEVVRNNVTHFRGQIRRLGYSFDDSREINTTDPAYYKWTQWIFLKMFEKGLAYKSNMPVNWCPSCKCVLANEEVIGGLCERCDTPAERRDKSQWMLKITAYAQRLLDDLDLCDYPSRVAAQQKNWIGRSEGAEISFPVVTGGGESLGDLRVYTTRPDTLFGATYMVISPEHPLAANAIVKNKAETSDYRCAAAKKSDFERTELAKDKTGVRLDGLCAVNPATGENIPIYVSDYVLMSYGTGAIMAVPGHDERDWAFAKAFGLPVIEVVAGGDVTKEAFTDTETGVLVNSGFLNGLEVAAAKVRMAEWLKEKGLGEPVVRFKLRDWVFARQRYWGEPIPIVHCPVCGMVPLSEDQLPLRLPEVKNYQPTETGESPLAAITDWVHTACPKCGASAKRETDTMPQWAGSSWYFLRYTDPNNDNALASKEALERWMPVDWYNGGMEHTTLHLLYSRFWHKFLYDIGICAEPEPYKKRTSHGFILGSDGTKISKTKNNGMDPDEVVRGFGADTLRLTILFIGDFEKGCQWSDKAIKGCRRFLERVWSVSHAAAKDERITPELEIKLHQTIKKVTEDIEELKFNTAIAAMMSLCTALEKGCTRGDVKVLLRLLSPFAPHLCEELWELYGGKGLICQAEWPVFDPAKTVEETVELAVQINGKLRGTATVPRGCGQDEAIAAALAIEKVATFAGGRTPDKAFVVPDKLVNLIFKG